MKNSITQHSKQFDNLPSNWKLVSFRDVLTDSTAGNVKIQQNEYLSEGKLPIIDQGKNLISGYSDDAKLAQNAKLPVILFGDHTRNLKFVDFPFALGADGVKILSSSEDTDPKYLFYFLKSINIPNTGYNRHFKYLKDLTIPLPLLTQQQHIACVLDQADQLRQQDRQLLAHYDALVQAVFVDLFGDLVRNEKGWKKQPLADFIDSERPITYGILMPGEDVADGVPYVRVVDIKGGRVLHEQVRRTTHKISSEYKRSLLVPGDLLISIRGHVGRMAITPKQLDGANITQDTARLSINSGSNPEFVRGCLESAEIQRVMKRYTKGVAVKGINLGDLRKIELPLPPLPLQQKFATIVAQIEQQKAAVQQQQAHSEALFQSLLQQAFRGELGS